MCGQLRILHQPRSFKNIFRRFYGVDPARTDGSYGLGLSIAEGMIVEHNGKIRAENINGHNKFFVSLPLQIAPSASFRGWFFIY